MSAKDKPDVPSITCPQCGAVSYNSGDIQNRYCGKCHQYHDEMQANLTRSERYVS